MNSKQQQNSNKPNLPHPDFIVYKDCDDYVESTADFEERIADEEEIAREFEWLSEFTVETSYLPRHWRSTPIIFEEVNPPDNFEEIVNDSRIVDVVNIDNFQDHRGNLIFLKYKFVFYQLKILK